MSNVKQKIINFLNGYAYPFCVAFFVLVGHLFSVEIYTIAFIALTVCAGFILCKDLKFFIAPLVCFYFIFSKRSLSSETFYDTPSLIFYGVAIFAVLFSIVIHFIVYRKEIKIKNFTSSALSKGLIVLIIALLISGLSSLQNYDLKNLVFGFLNAIAFALPFFLFSINLEIDKTTKHYLCYVLILTSLVITVEFLWLFINGNVIQNGSIYKGALDLGWGVSNNIGAILAMLMPIYFYCASQSKYFLLFFLGGLLTYGCVLLSLSRAAILFATPILGACVLFLCIRKHKQRKQAIVYTLVLFVVACVGCVLIKDTLFTAFNHIIRAGFNDSGRFEYYESGMEKFFDAPIFGVGFWNTNGFNYSFVIVAPNYLHNTVIQLLASCGIVGFVAYVYHRYQTIKLFVKNRNAYSFYIAMSILALLLTSLLDIHLFNIFPTIIYSTMLCIFEKIAPCQEENDKAEV